MRSTTLPKWGKPTAIERLFRFIEMIGIIALIQAVVATSFPLWTEVVTSILGTLAVFYLTEPTFDAIANLLIHRPKPTLKKENRSSFSPALPLASWHGPCWFRSCLGSPP